MESDFDPLAAETFDSPYEEYRRLRETCPVAHSAAWGGFWALTKHADVAAAAADYRTFITSVQNVVPKVAFTGRRPPLHLDPPEHTPYRRALAPLLSERRVALLEPVIREICRELLAPMVAKGGGDIVAEFSAPIGGKVCVPMTVNGLPPIVSRATMLGTSALPSTMTSATSHGTRL